MRPWTRQGFLAPWCNAVLTWVDGFRILPSVDVTPTYIPGIGTILKVNKNAGRASATTETAWVPADAAGGVTVPHGPVLWGTVWADTTWFGYTTLGLLAGGDGPQAVSWPVVEDGTHLRVLYVELNLSAGAVEGCVTVKFHDTDLTDEAGALAAAGMPVDEGLVLRRPIGLYSITATTTEDTTTTSGSLAYMFPPPIPSNIASVLPPPRIPEPPAP